MPHVKSVNIVHLFLCACIFIVKIHAQWSIDDEGCRTPDGGVGDCIPIRQCKPITNFLTTASKPLPQNVITHLNKYTCSYESNGVKVCCPPKPIEFGTQNPQPQVTPTPQIDDSPPPDVTNHKNINLLPEDCGYLPSGDKISYGKDADLNEFPWMALLSYTTIRGPLFKCGGSIITDKWILTAAHCITGLTEPLLGVRVGEHNINSRQDCQSQENGSKKCAPPVQDLAIEEIIIHPKFNATIISHDIGLLRVTKMNLKVENVRPVCLPIDDSRNAKFSNVVVTGWGITEKGRQSNILQKVALPVVSLEQCQSAYKKEARVRITNKLICAGGKNRKDSCSGDSGGPMHVAAYINDATRYVQQGIVSFGPRECGLSGYPGVYTKIAYYMDWILDTIKP